MRLGPLLSSSGFKVTSFLEGARKAKEMGYECVELGANDPSGTSAVADLGHYSIDEVRNIVDEIRNMGMEISALQCHVGYLFSDDAQLRHRIEHTKRMLEVASRTGVQFVHTVTGHRPNNMTVEQAWQILTRTYNELLDYANDVDVRLGIEPVFVYHVGNLSTTRELMHRLGRTELFINFDPSHFPFHRESPVPFIHEFASKIIHAHAKDAMVTQLKIGDPLPAHAFYMGNEEASAFAAPGRGQLNWNELLQALREVGFDGVLSLELGHGIPDEESAARDTVTFFRGLL
ncbi:MAG TPA: sugar phosphate isomerase/epimerase [Armatimonadetes bacterium]|nr:sugar phosphate isomerase/epimerase [Armatimonadota bacterium]